MSALIDFLKHRVKTEAAHVQYSTERLEEREAIQRAEMLFGSQR